MQGRPRAHLYRGPLKLATAVVAACLAVACSNSGGGDSSGGNGGSVPAVQKGFFRAGNVAGLQYASGQQSGVTDAHGGYACEAGEPVSFSVGTLVLGEMPCASVAHAVALAPSGQLTDQAALNIMRLLLILDEDENPDNGVFISEPIQTIAENWLPIDFGAADFFPEITLIVADIASLENRVVGDLPSEDATLAYLQSALACAYSGVYFNVYQSATFGAPLTVSLNVFPVAGPAAAVAEFFLLRQELVRGVTAVGSGSVQLSASPMVRSAVFDADFVGPDLVSGTWVASTAQQSFDRQGAYVASRLGGGNGEYRFTGKIEAPRSLYSAGLSLRIELELDGDTISGRSFDNIFGLRLDITGRRVPGSDEFEIEIESLGTATGTILRNADGEPVGLQGNWPGYDETVLEAEGCRLI